MIEVWTSNEKHNDRLIAFGNNIIYKANPKTEQDTDILASGLESGSFDSTKVWEIRTSNCKEIRLQDGRPYIEIYWGRDGEEQLRITDEYRRYKVFELIKTNTPHAKFSSAKWSILRAGRKPMIAFFVVLALSVWTLYYAIEAERGYVYYLENGHYNSITGIVLAIASLGLSRVILIFSVLLAVVVFAFVRKAKNRTVTHSLIIER